MPLFYFHLWSKDDYIADPKGSEHVDLDAARREAIVGARCILSGDIKAGLLDLDQRFELHDEHGRHLMTIPFAHAVNLSQAGSGALSLVTARSGGD